MLEIKTVIPRNTYKYPYINTIGSGATSIYSGDTIIVTSEKHGLKNGDYVHLIKHVGKNTKTYTEDKIITVIDDDNFSIESFTDKSIYVNEIKRLNNNLLLTLKDEHYYIKDREDVAIFEYVYSPEYNSNVTINKVCNKNIIVDDYLLYIGMTSSGVEGDYRYTLNENYFNEQNKYVYYYDENNELNDQVLSDNFIPSNYNGSDNEYGIIIRNAPDELFEYTIPIIYVNDIRFAPAKDKLYEGVEIYKRANTLNINFPLSENIDVLYDSTFNNERNYIEKLVNENINPIVDYEKQIFVPVIYGGASYMKKLTFNLNLLARDEYGELLTDNNGLSYRIPMDNNRNVNYLTEVGFTEDDIKYQKNRIAKSFIRISIYDTPNRGSQTLLMYSTIFLDAGRIYTDYMRLKAFDEGKADKSIKDGIVPINLSFRTSNKLNMMEASDGFYLYLYPDNIPEGFSSAKTLYMQISFNNANYGEFAIMSFKNQNGYYTKAENGMRGVNMKNYYDDTYIKIQVCYNKDKGEYQWCFSPDNIENESLVEKIITLYEPIVNGDFKENN